MSVQVYGCNHVAIEVDDLAKAQAFYKTFLASNLSRVAKVMRFSSSEIISFSP
jgi:predicted enzyme related to lactoylglutathione lyase